jgi:hypothetical protein
MTYRHRLAAIAIVLLVYASVTLAAESVVSTRVGFAFSQSAVPVFHMERTSVVDLRVSMTYRLSADLKDYPDTKKLVPDAIGFLQNYPDKQAYWESYASGLAVELLSKHAALRMVQVVLVIQPDDQRSYVLTATASATAEGD